MKKSKMFLGIGICMVVIAVAFFAFALNHTEKSFNCSNAITHAIYVAYLIVTVIMFVMSIICRKK